MESTLVEEPEVEPEEEINSDLAKLEELISEKNTSLEGEKQPSRGSSRKGSLTSTSS